MSTRDYEGLYRKPGITVEHEGDEVMIWATGGGGVTFTRGQWKSLIISEYRRLGLGRN